MCVQLEPGGLVPNLPTRPEAGMTMPVSQTGNLKLREEKREEEATGILARKKDQRPIEPSSTQGPTHTSNEHWGYFQASELPSPRPAQCPSGQLEHGRLESKHH